MATTALNSASLPSTSSGVVSSGVPGGEAPTVTVVGKRPDESINVIGPAVDRYILALKERWSNDHYFAAGHQFLLQPASVCLELAGLDQESTQRFRNQLQLTMASYGVQLERYCQAQISIQFSSDFSSLIRYIQRHPSVVNYGTSGGDIADLSRFSLPVRWVANGRLGQLRHTWIFIDGARLGSIAPGALVNYVAFVALVVPNNNPVVENVYSIANMFTDDNRSSDHWTRLDNAFVKALYSFQPQGNVSDALLRERTITQYSEGNDNLIDSSTKAPKN